MNGKASFVETDGHISAAKLDPIWGSLGAVHILEKILERRGHFARQTLHS